ncbi:chorismate mutase [Dinoroseobacter sp. PD6]|uniref:chorismate mutase n=1 Tax=Dinoroseobacter sp. PD6 TaxID=3028384 RepID=UPI00237ACA59|nr:chorismate mutase [Dinoroseobacter sp. PD6]MDD9716127.1 chorismate mutase [Dinoroseobacter sp. PD6]
MRAPEDCNSMAELRAAIDTLDRSLVALLARRAGYIDRAIALKPAENLPARIEDRVAQVKARVRAEADTQGLDPDLVEGLWHQLIEWSIAREEVVLGADAPKETRER